MNQSLIVGVDVSKSTLDVFFRPSGVSMRISNNLSGFKQWHRAFKGLADPFVQSMVVMEYTGQYSYRFECFLRSKSIDYCRLPALQIKRSLGMLRGKNDKVDAQRIAEYAWLRRDILTADQYPLEEILELRQLLSFRSKLVRDRSGYISRLKEMKASGMAIEVQLHRKVIEFLNRSILEVQARIDALIASHSALQSTSDLLRSIKGVGPVIAAHMIGCTENFKRFRNARKFNCYAGLAPFKQESGSSIRGRSRVSHLASKQTKTLLNLAASSAIQHDTEMKAYYQRRVAEGKNKMSCLNIIRSKIVARMFAVIKRQTPYQLAAPAA